MRNFTVVDVPQKSHAWFEARLGRLTGSVAGDILVKRSDGKPAAGRQNLLMRLLLERVTGHLIDEPENGYNSYAMKMGVEREDAARAAYEALTGELVRETGFLAHTSLLAGASLDGHLGDFEKVLSIKCRQPAAHWECLRTGTIPAAAFAQIRHELWITGAKEADYFSYNPDFPPHLQSNIKTVTRNQAELGLYESEAIKFLDEVDREVSALQGWKALEGVLADRRDEVLS